MVVLSKYYRINLIAVFAASIFLWQGATAQSSVLQKGAWYKIVIEKDGVYKISYDFLKKMGIDPNKINPKKIRLFGNSGGMLPQANATPRPIDLTENAIYIKGEEDEIFNSDDFILFYAQGPDKSYFDTSRGIFFYENNLYTDKNFCFLTLGEENGKRIGTSENLTGTFPLIQEYNDYVFHETDQYNELQSGREWTGEKFDLVTEQTLKFEIEGIKENSFINVVSDVMAKSYTGSSFKLFFNNVLITEQYVLPISEARYALKGYHKRDSIKVAAAAVSASALISQEVNYQYLKTQGKYGVGNIDFLLISFTRKLSRYGNQTIFQSATSLANAVSQFEVLNASNTILWDISNPAEPRQQDHTLIGNTATFATPTTSLKQFIIFSNAGLLEPQFVNTINNQDLHSLPAPPTLLIVTHPSFATEASRLANHREQHSQISVAVVTPDEIYHEFSSGRQDVSAIRDFIKYLYDKNSGTLKNVLLFGRCSYDYKDRMDKNTNFVPTYESRNSLHPLETYSSDDYFGFLENSEGNWGEFPVENHTLDIGVGRLPVTTEEEARNVVNKIINYDTNNNTLGQWRKNIVFIADDGDLNQHQLQADDLAKFVESNYPQYNSKKIFIDEYPQIVKPNGESVPEANKKVQESLDRGSLIINYTGHGGEKQLAQERIFDDFIIETLDNQNLPLFVTATCEFGRHDDPLQTSSAELCVVRPNSGAIGMVTTARPVNSSTNFELNKAFYQALWQLQDGKPLTLGEIFRRTKNNSISGVSNRNFSLLADPSLTLAFPTLEASITSIKTAANTDTLKALSHVIVKGEILNAGQPEPSFSGTLSATLFDKESMFTTLGNENPPFSFFQRTNILFKGQASVMDGVFEFEFVVPKNIAYQIGKGKLSVYAYDITRFLDATGVSLDFTVGKSEPNPENDTTPPDISLFMGDSTFLNGGITSPTTQLVAKLFDQSGITLSDYGIGNGITAILDNTQSFNLNDYYESNINDFTTGWISFPLKDLEPGAHTITLKAWDTYNNPASATVDFLVTDGNILVIENFRNYPNPFQESTTLYFTHNRAGDDLETILSIYDITGNLLKTSEKVIYSSEYRVNLMELNNLQDFSQKLRKGLYLARLSVRSLTNGSKNERVAKLIIVN